MLDIVPPELTDLFKHGVSNLGASKRLVRELVVGQLLRLNDEGRRRETLVGVRVGVMVSQMGNGLRAATERESKRRQAVRADNW